MNRVLKISTLALSVIFAGCSNDQSEGNAPGSDGSAVFSTVISRVGDTQWESGDQVGMMVTKDNSIYDNLNYKYNALYDAATDGSLTPNEADSDNTFYYPTDGTNIDFYAYYPYNEALVEEEESYPIDVTDQSTPTKIDFMEASTIGDGESYSKSNPDVSLSFNRRMAKLTFTVVAGEQVELSNITGITIEGFYATSIYSMSGNSFGSFSDVVSIAPYEGGSNTYSAILIPMAEADGEVITDHVSPKVVFATNLGDDNNDTITWVLSSYNVTLKAGQHNIYTLRVNYDGISASGGIGSWDYSGDPEDLVITQN